MRKLLPAVVLFLLSPMIGELLLGSAPPAEFFNPLGFVVLTILYGGAILVRELTVRWQKGSLILLVLGVACGIISKALAPVSAGWLLSGRRWSLSGYHQWLCRVWPLWGNQRKLH